MKQPMALLLAAALLLALAGCDLPVGANPSGTAAPSAAAGAESAAAAPASAAPSATATAEPTPEPTDPGVLSPEVYEWFERAGFAGERDGSPAITKWTAPVSIQVEGSPNREDGHTLHRLIERLRGIKGMPDIVPVTQGGAIVIGFVPRDKGTDVHPGYNGTDDSAVFIEWSGGDAWVRILIADELTDRGARDRALARCLLLGLGLADGGDPNGVLNAVSDGAAAPSDTDWTLLRLLYGADIQNGMSPADAMPVVKRYDPEAAGTAGRADIGREEQLAYFNEIGFYWSGTASDGIVSKWASAVRLQIKGEPTAEQEELLHGYLEAIGRVPGFPGFETVESGGDMVISFQTAGELKNEFPNMMPAESCYIQVTRARNGKISKCVIGVANDFPEPYTARNHFLRLLMRSLGFHFTSDAYPDSIFNYDSDVQDWSNLDWSMLALLYDPAAKPGDKRAAVLKKLAAQ